MSDNVSKLELVEVGERFRFDADLILEEAKGKPFTRLAVIGQLKGGALHITGNCNAGEALILMEQIKLQIVRDG
jgi:hypothetical protein